MCWVTDAQWTWTPLHPPKSLHFEGTQDVTIFNTIMSIRVWFMETVNTSLQMPQVEGLLVRFFLLIKPYYKRTVWVYLCLSLNINRAVRFLPTSTITHALGMIACDETFLLFSFKAVTCSAPSLSTCLRAKTAVSIQWASLHHWCRMDHRAWLEASKGSVSQGKPGLPQKLPKLCVHREVAMCEGV